MDLLADNQDLGDLLAVGYTAEIYAWQPGWVLKLFFPRFGLEMANYEQRLAQAIGAAGLPTPAVGEIMTIGTRKGLLYERIDGLSMSAEMEARPQKLAVYAIQLAELHWKLHTKEIEVDIPLLRNRLAFKLSDASPLPTDLRQAALDALNKMPDGDRLCHGDFHPGNILIADSKSVIIDWVDASIGNPLADVARTSILALGFAAVQAAPAQSTAIKQLHQIYLNRYFQLHPGGEEEYQNWLPIVAAARLNEGITELENWLLSQAKALVL